MKEKRYLKKLFCILLSAVLLSGFAGLVSPAAAASANERAIYNYLKHEMGLNTAAACGVLANIEKESNFDPHAHGDSGTSYGICQWHGPRYKSLKSYCKRHRLNYTTIEGQMAYLNYELHNDYPKTTEILYSVPNTGEGAYTAAYNWCYRFEVPYGYNTGVSDKRAASAKYTYWPVYHAEDLEAAAARRAVAALRGTTGTEALKATPGHLLAQFGKRMSIVLRTLFSALQREKN